MQKNITKIKLHLWEAISEGKIEVKGNQKKTINDMATELYRIIREGE